MQPTRRLRNRDTGAYAREWVPLSDAPDEVMARMTVTYLEAARVEARVACHGEHFCVEVPAEQFDHACAVCGPVDSGIFPTMQESTGNTGIHPQPHPETPAQPPAADSRLARNIVLCIGLVALLAALVWRMFLA